MVRLRYVAVLVLVVALFVFGGITLQGDADAGGTGGGGGYVAAGGTQHPDTPPSETLPFEATPSNAPLIYAPPPWAPPAGTQVAVAAMDAAVDDTPPPPIEYGYNMYDIGFDTLILDEQNNDIKDIHEYVAGLQASHQNEYTGIFKGKNLILITAESFSKEVVDPVMTPTLYRLMHKGFYFSDYYQPLWGGSTSSGEYSILSGLIPMDRARSILKTRKNNLSFTIGNKLMALGYSSAAYHNGTNTFYYRDTTHTKFGYETFTAMGNGMEEYMKHRWPNSDLEMMEYSIPQYIDRQPFSVYYMTISGHSRYTKDGNSMARKNWDAFPEQYAGMTDAVRAYMACNLELEYALAYLVGVLEEKGVAGDTVIVLSSDHHPYALRKSEKYENDEDYLPMLYGYKIGNVADRDHNALIIWSGSLEGEQEDLVREVGGPTYPPDILPTLCNLFGLKYDSRLLVGRDVFSDAEPLAIWNTSDWKTELGFYNAARNKFTPAPDAEIPDGYVERVKSIVKGKLEYSQAALDNDYFGVLFDEDGKLRVASGADKKQQIRSNKLVLVRQNG